MFICYESIRSDNEQISRYGKYKSRCVKLFSLINEVLAEIREEEAKIRWPEENGLIFLLWIISLIIDPLLFYIPAINYDKKSVVFDRTKSFPLYITYILLCLVINYVYYANFKKQGSGVSFKSFFIYIPVSLPVYSVSSLKFPFLAPNFSNFAIDLALNGVAVDDDFINSSDEQNWCAFNVVDFHTDTIAVVFGEDFHDLQTLCVIGAKEVIWSQNCNQFCALLIWRTCKSKFINICVFNYVISYMS